METTLTNLKEVLCAAEKTLQQRRPQMQNGKPQNSTLIWRHAYGDWLQGKAGKLFKKINENKPDRTGRGFTEGNYGTAAQLTKIGLRGVPKESANGLVNESRGGSGLFLLALFLLLGVLLGLVSEAHGDGGAQERQGEHQSHQFLHCVSPLGCDEQLVWDNHTQRDMNYPLSAN